MRQLNNNEIKQMSESLSFTLEETKEIAEIFYAEKENGNCRLRCTELNTVRDYITEYENSWYRYPAWNQLLESEKDQGEDGLTPEQCENEKGISIFQLTSGMYVQTVY